jgi:hypothetical protein
MLRRNELRQKGKCALMKTPVGRAQPRLCSQPDPCDRPGLAWHSWSTGPDTAVSQAETATAMMSIRARLPFLTRNVFGAHFILSSAMSRSFYNVGQTPSTASCAALVPLLYWNKSGIGIDTGNGLFPIAYLSACEDPASVVERPRREAACIPMINPRMTAPS